ncbi:MAG: hypothetical protein BWX79_01676 [Alphaproteobacteria bacterium ADurb.Bin100]|nr:MAG: hypothetical protein BWX79_01676 [Alphaproteobacteria bacterium ADurb.Bin100]
MVANSFSAVTRKITALTVVMARTKLYTSAATSAGLSSGSTTLNNVCAVEARSISEASSSDLSSCRKAAVPARTPTGRLRNMKHSMMIRPVPVSSTGGTLKARM